VRVQVSRWVISVWISWSVPAASTGCRRVNFWRTTAMASSPRTVSSSTSFVFRMGGWMRCRSPLARSAMPAPDLGTPSGGMVANPGMRTAWKAS
jgi:hypothetical protein